jgi:tungstate transport system substrate-binding protein
MTASMACTRVFGKNFREHFYKKGFSKAILLFLCTVVVFTLFSLPLGAEERLKLATTTSTDNSGLLDVLLPPFEKKMNVKVDVIAVGTGKALKLGESGDVDVVMVHAPALEEKFVADGFGVSRRGFMYNDFVIVGPEEDGAGIGGASDAAQAFVRIARSESTFVSRGDESGTHQKEKSIWKEAGITPSGGWYLETGLAMGNVLVISDQKRAYTLADRGTFLAFKSKVNLKVLFSGDPLLQNPYSIIAVNPRLHPNVNHAMAMALIDWVTSPEGQGIIASYRVRGEALFHPSAASPSH